MRMLPMSKEGEVQNPMLSWNILQKKQIVSNTIEGMIPFRSINTDAFVYDDNRKVAVGRRSGEIFTLGTPLEVSVRRASKSESQIDFALIRRLDKDKPKNANDDRKKKPRR